METPITVVVLAAGLGTRMKSKRAKVLHRAGGQTLVEHVVDTALELTAAERVFVVVGHQADQVRQALDGRGAGFIEQIEQKGTGHALLVGREALAPLEGFLVVLYGDCPLISAATLRRLIDEQAASGAAATVITTLLDDPTGYGRMILDSERNVTAIVEQKAASPDQLAVREINSGMYCFRAELLWRHIGQIRPDNPAREYYLTDVVGLLHRAGHTVRAMRVDNAAEVLGINNRIELAGADRVLRDRKVRELMLEGVTIEKPETVTIDARVRIGPDTVIEAFAQILGGTRIGEGCRVGACSIVQDSDLAGGVEVLPFSMIGASRIEAGARIGPYARLRMGNHVEAGAHIGNFVELKKTHFGAGSKAMHLAYLGDAEIGRGVNVGAGTITCNYDGRKKHQTTVGDGVFIGSNNTLVAPVEIGEGGYTAAGSVITDKVPPGALALGRARQVNKEGWKKKGREG
ncbi:MAG: bifunctional UDP-N-acetylglucosamine diphosphorylase/glucosamine-1-phosphate N-acetyltransferase GlmU [Acidobacteria bacterium]|nr:bifunctional UDP-N-acetylglucosamine diphosphorylase/glucosamine-1-phosphate N-acetyltransferase GlmU [Acidobacteriota bacterium]